MAKPIISFISLILSIGFAVFYVVPAYNLNVERRGNIESLSKILNTSSEIRTLIDKTKINLQNIDPQVLARFNVFLPERIDTIRLANNLQNIGLKDKIILSGIKVTPAGASADTKSDTTSGAPSAVQGLVNIISLGAQIDKAQGSSENTAASVDTSVSGGKYAITNASFSFVSSYETFQLLLNDLEKSLGLINVTSLSFTPVVEDASKSTKVSSTPMYQYQVQIETYSLH
jgi:hypothetical protein